MRKTKTLGVDNSSLKNIKSLKNNYATVKYVDEKVKYAGGNKGVPDLTSYTKKVDLVVYVKKSELDEKYRTVSSI